MAAGLQSTPVTMIFNFPGRAVSTSLATAVVAVAAAVGACGSGGADGGSPSGFPVTGDDGSDASTPTYDGSTLGLGGGGGEAGTFTLALNPPTATLTVDGTSAKSAAFALKATYSGNGTTVTPDSLQVPIDPTSRR